MVDRAPTWPGVVECSYTFEVISVVGRLMECEGRGTRYEVH